MKPFLKSRLVISVISFMELLSFLDITEEDEKKIRLFLGNCELSELQEQVREQTIQLRRKYRIKLPDAVIAATAIIEDLTLITADKGFQKIEGLSLYQLQP